MEIGTNSQKDGEIPGDCKEGLPGNEGSSALEWDDNALDG